MRRSIVATLVAFGIAVLTASGAVADAGRRGAEVRVDGTVATPMSYSLAQLQALPQTTFSLPQHGWRGSHTDAYAGVAVEDLVNAAGPVLSNAKNALLRVTVTVTGRDRQGVTFALGELDPAFGDHPAYLALSRDGRALRAPELAVPGDSTAARSLAPVDHVTVGVQNPAPTMPPTPGALTIENDGMTSVLPASTLAVLPAQTLQVTFQAGTSPQQHTETGPSLNAVLRAAHVRLDLNTWVAAVGSDGYVATVTPAEAWVGGGPLLISLAEDGQLLAQPRLVADGDVKGGRYVSGVVDLVIGHVLAAGVPWWIR